MRVIAPADLPAKLGSDLFSRTTIWRAEKAGTWPKRIRFSARKYGWLETEIDAWIAARISERATSPPQPLQEPVGAGREFLARSQAVTPLAKFPLLQKVKQRGGGVE